MTTRIYARAAAVGFLVAMGLSAPSTALAGTIDVSTLLSNSSYESGITGWTAMFPNSSYLVLGTNFGVNPPQTIFPLDPCCSNGTLLPELTAPVGNNFIGVLNPDDADLKGKLGHSVIAGTFLSTDIYQVTVWANRGRLGDGNTNSVFTSEPPGLNVQLVSWTAGTTPVLQANGTFSRSPTLTDTKPFMDWGNPGEWASQTFTFTLPTNRAFLTLAIAGMNNSHDSYVGWDIGPTAVVPEPASLLLFGTGVAAVARRRKRRT